MSRRPMLRAAALSVALLVASGSVALARPATTSSGPRSSSKPVASRLLDNTGAASEKAHRRGIVNARWLSKQEHPARPTTLVPAKLRSQGVKRSDKGIAPAPADTTPPPPPIVQATLTTTPQIAKAGFDGIARSEDWAGSEPPDPWVGVGPEHVVQVVNRTVRVTDRQGVPSQADIPLPDFFLLPTDPVTFESDPHIVYDSLHGRWFATEVSWDCATSASASFGTGYVDFAVSRTADPTGDWDVYSVDYSDFLPDFPAPGLSSDKLAIGSNFFAMAAGSTCVENATFSKGHISVMDIADLLNGDPISIIGDDLDAFTPRFALQVPATSPRLHLIDATSQAHVEYRSIVGSASANPPTLAYERIDDLTGDGVIEAFADPPAPQQPGPDTVTTAIDGRPTDAIWQGDRLIFVSGIGCTPTGDSTVRSCVRVSELRTNTVPGAEPTLKQDFVIAANGKDKYMGGVGFAGNGTLQVVWTGSSTTAGEFPSSFAGYQLSTDAADTLKGVQTLKAGIGAYTGTRWGDYVGVAQDPMVPSATWQANQYAGTGPEWLTYVNRLQPTGTTYVPITPVRVLDTRISKGLSGMFTANQARTWQVGGTPGIPANAVAITGNVTVTQQQALGYVAVTPTATNTPPSSTINFPTGDNRANNLVVPLSATGSLSAVYRSTTGKKTHLIVDVTGYFLANDTGATFKSLTPARILDTRSNKGLAGKFVNGTARQLTVAGFGGVPAGAKAITGNLTVTQQSAGGYLSVSPGVPAATPATSNLNFPVSDNRANGLFAPLDGAGKLWIVYKSVAGSTTHVILDVTGYFVQGLTGLHFVPLNPGRIMDTRSAALLSGLSGQFGANASRILEVDGHWGVPAGSKAITGNLTVTAQTGPGYISVSPNAPPPAPATSTLNFPLGDNRANGLVAPLDVTGNTYLVYIAATGRKTDLILDLSGYFE